MCIRDSITSLPTGGANYRIAKTVANGNWFNGNAQPLSLGVNTITVASVSFDRSVKIQFSSGDIDFNSIVHNGSAVNLPPELLISSSNLFENGPNTTWSRAYVSTQITDGAASQSTQTFEINVTSLPAGGANYRIAKTVANGNWFNGTPQPLTVGVNTITVSSVSFDRTVKIQFSTGDIALSLIHISEPTRLV